MSPAGLQGLRPVKQERSCSVNLGSPSTPCSRTGTGDEPPISISRFRGARRGISANTSGSSGSVRRLEQGNEAILQSSSRICSALLCRSSLVLSAGHELYLTPTVPQVEHWLAWNELQPLKRIPYQPFSLAAESSPSQNAFAFEQLISAVPHKQSKRHSLRFLSRPLQQSRILAPLSPMLLHMRAPLRQLSNTMEVYR